MSVQICLLRGVNVGGRNRLAMTDLRRTLEELGARDVATYIQSGNAVFRGDIPAPEISRAIGAQAGFRPHALVVGRKAYAALLEANPFRGSDAVHVYFCDGDPHPIPDSVAGLATPTERVAVTPGAAFLLAPDGIGRSRLAARLGTALGVPVTARNWKTASMLNAMAERFA